MSHQLFWALQALHPQVLGSAFPENTVASDFAWVSDALYVSPGEIQVALVAYTYPAPKIGDGVEQNTKN
jgi:hypothetical protein